MSRSGKLFEQLVKTIQETVKDSRNTIVQTNVKLKNTANVNREIDVLVTTVENGRPIMIAFECKDFSISKKKVDVQVLDAMYGKCSLLPQIDKMVVVSRTGFTPNAHKIAVHYGIELSTFEDLSLDKVFDCDNPLMRVAPLFNLKKFVFKSRFNVQNSDFDINLSGDVNCEVIRDIAEECLHSVSEDKRVELLLKYIDNGRHPFEETIVFKHTKDSICFNINGTQNILIDYIAITVDVWFEEERFKLTQHSETKSDGNTVNVKHYRCSTGVEVEEIATTNNHYMLYIKDEDDTLRQFNISSRE